MSLMTLAEDIGLEVERRPVPVEELKEFDEVGACGTAAVISPIGEIYDRDNDVHYRYCDECKAGPVSTKLYNRLKNIQEGVEEDKFGWNYVVELD